MTAPAAERRLFRAEHRGALIAPETATPEGAALRPQARRRGVDDPEEAAERAREAEDAARRAVVAMQRAIGLPCVTDGAAADPGFAAALAGVQDGRALDRPGFPADHPVLARAQALGAVAGGPFKASLQGPDALLALDFSAAPTDLRDPEARAAAAGSVCGAALAALDAAGVRHAQLDLSDAAEATLAALATALGARPAALTVALAVEALTPPQAEALFALGADVHLLPDDPDLVGLLPRGRQRALIWAPAAAGPIPSRDALARAVEAAARRADPDQLGLAPLSGFAAPADATPDQRRRAFDDQRRALDRLVEAADAFWGRLDG